MMNPNKIVLILALLIFPALYAAPFAYVVGLGNVVIIDVATNTIINTIEIPYATLLSSIAITPDNKFAYVVDNESAIGLDVLDLTTNTFVDAITVGDHANTVAITPDGKYVFVGGPINTFNVIATANNMPIAGSPFTTALNNCNGVAISPDGLTAYITDASSNKVVAISVANPTSQTIISGIGISNGLNGIAITADSNTAYVANSGDHAVYAINNLKSSPTVSTGILVGSDPASIVITPDNTTAYVTNDGDGTVSLINLKNNAVSTITVGSPSATPAGLAITSDGSFVYVANKIANTVAVIPTSTNTPITPPIDFSLYPGPTAIAITSTSTASFAGTIRNNVFLDKTERILIITWTASTDTSIVSYNIYNGTTIVGNVLATAPLTFNALLANGDNGQNFSITAVDSNGVEGSHTPVIVH
jgi:YVTN family beta-propeller protein